MSSKIPITTSAEERWKQRYDLSDAQLSDASAECLTHAGEMLDSEYVMHEEPYRANLWLGRAQWYMVRLESKQRSFREGIISVLGGDAFSVNAGLPHRTDWAKRYDPPAGAGSQLYPTTGKDLGQTVDHSDRRTAGPKPIPPLKCLSSEYHGEHTWDLSDDDPSGPGTFKCSGRYRPIKDNPQA